MAPTIPERAGVAEPFDMSYAADFVAAAPGVPLGRVSAVTARRARAKIREQMKEDARRRRARAAARPIDALLHPNKLGKPLPKCDFEETLVDGKFDCGLGREPKPMPSKELLERDGITPSWPENFREELPPRVGEDRAADHRGRWEARAMSPDADPTLGFDRAGRWEDRGGFGDGNRGLEELTEEELAFIARRDHSGRWQNRHGARLARGYAAPRTYAGYGDVRGADVAEEDVARAIAAAREVEERGKVGPETAFDEDGTFREFDPNLMDRDELDAWKATRREDAERALRELRAKEGMRGTVRVHSDWKAPPRKPKPPRGKASTPCWADLGHAARETKTERWGARTRTPEPGADVPGAGDGGETARVKYYVTPGQARYEKGGGANPHEPHTLGGTDGALERVKWGVRVKSLPPAAPVETLPDVLVTRNPVEFETRHGTSAKLLHSSTAEELIYGVKKYVNLEQPTNRTKEQYEADMARVSKHVGPVP